MERRRVKRAKLRTLILCLQNMYFNWKKPTNKLFELGTMFVFLRLSALSHILYDVQEINLDKTKNLPFHILAWMLAENDCSTGHPVIGPSGKENLKTKKRSRKWLANLETVVGPSIEDFRERMKCLWKINSLIYVCWDINDMSLNWQTNTFHTFKRRNLVFVLKKSVHLDTHWPGCQFYSWLGRWCTWN